MNFVTYSLMPDDKTMELHMRVSKKKQKILTLGMFG